MTGDSLGQVASQTLANMAAVDEAATLPVLRPLVGWEKQEIIDEARSIGTAEISVLPDEDCCKLLAPPRVSLRAGLTDLQSVEKRLDLDDVVDGLLRDVQIMYPGETGGEGEADAADSPDTRRGPAPGRPVRPCVRRGRPGRCRPGVRRPGWCRHDRGGPAAGPCDRDRLGRSGASDAGRRAGHAGL